MAAIVWVDLLTSDASVAAQIFFFFPTLYGASQLPRAGALVMTAASVLGEVVVVVSLLPLEEALIDIGYVSAALVTTAMILIRSGERHAEVIENLERLAAMDPVTRLVAKRLGPNRAGIVPDMHRPAFPARARRLARPTADGEADPGCARQRRDPGCLSADHRAVLRSARRGRGPAEVDRRGGSTPFLRSR